jgi:hypothetical protein
LEAVVAVKPDPAGVVLRVPADVVVRDDRNPLHRSIENLKPESGHAVELGIGLPAVDDPGLDLELVGGKDLDPDTVEEPRGVVRGERVRTSSTARWPVSALKTR